MGLAALLFSNPVLFVILAGLLLYSVILHEVAHGWVAHLFGDDTARHYGRLTLNPASHIDPIGLISLFLVGFGWAKPVPVNYNNLRSSRFGLMCVALAGCAMNIFIAIFALLLLQSGMFEPGSFLASLLPIVIKINIILGAFNLIPIPPLDGSKILMGFLPERAQETLARIEPFGFFILIFLLFTGLLNPVIDIMQALVSGFIVSLLRFLR